MQFSSLSLKLHDRTNASLPVPADCELIVNESENLLSISSKCIFTKQVGCRNVVQRINPTLGHRKSRTDDEERQLDISALELSL